MGSAVVRVMSTLGEDSELTDEAPGQPPFFLPVALGLGGIFLAIIALLMSLGGNSSAPAGETGDIGALRAELAALRAQIEEQQAASDAQTARRRQLAAETQDALNQLADRLGRLSQQQGRNSAAIDTVIKNLRQLADAGELNELASDREDMEPVMVDRPTLTESDDGSATGPTSSGTVHRIQRGETLSGLASRYGVSLQAILNANPGINPNRLQIGDAINIPAS